jgi:prepilin-type N-terminal cleavage/methylation domain-containing protein
MTFCAPPTVCTLISRPSTDDQRGFTLIELIIVVAVIAVLAAIAVPIIRAAKIRANESVAIAVLRNVVNAQQTLQTRKEIDGDLDGTGEFGYFAELSAVRNTRLLEKGKGTDGESDFRLSNGILPTAFGDLDEKGLVHRSGYLFRMALPGPNLEWKWEKPLEKRYPKVSPTYSASYWALYAWPQVFGSSGNRAFFVNQVGEIIGCQNQLTRYSGEKNKPQAGAAFMPRPGGGGGKDQMDDEMAIDSMGGDGNFWTVTR